MVGDGGGLAFHPQGDHAMAKVRLTYMRVDGKFTTHHHVPAWERRCVRAGWRGHDVPITETPTHELREVDTSPSGVAQEYNRLEATYSRQIVGEQLRSPEALTDEIQSAIQETDRWLAEEKARQDREHAAAAKRNEQALEAELADLEKGDPTASMLADKPRRKG